MTNLERLAHRGYFDKAEENGEDLTGDSRGDTLDAEKDEKDVDKDAGTGDTGDDKAELEDDKPKGHMIPKERFDEAVNKARKEAADAIKRADELQEKLNADNGIADTRKVEAEIDVLEDELEDAIKDGNVDKKKAVRAQIREKNQQLADSRAVAHATRASAVAIEQIRYDATVERLEAEHPALNPDSEEFDEEVVLEITELKEAFEAKGHSSSESLKKAVKVIYKGAKPPADKEADKDGADRKEAAVKKGLDTKGKQPADTKKAGLDSNKGGKTKTAADAAKMSDEEFDKLSEAELKKLRGDAE